MFSLVRDLVVRWWEGGTPEIRRVSGRTLRVIYGVWLLAFALKLIGSSWDVAWHFKYLREDLAIPHVVNTIGFMVAIGVLLFQTLTGLAADRWGLRLAQAGVATFLVAIPLDVLNHRLFGLDITSWSITHAMLYLGTAILLAGVIRNWFVAAPPGRSRTAYAIALWAFLLEDILFPLGQQEYGTLAFDAYLKGRSTASADLIQIAGAHPEKFALGGVPAWLYPLWLIVMSMFVLIAAKKVIHTRWAATTIAGLYLAYRYVAYLVLTSFHFPPSFVPFMLLLGAVALDVALALKWRPVAGTLVVLVAFYAGALLTGSVTLMPQFPIAAAPIIGLLLWSGWVATPYVERGRQVIRDRASLL